MNKKEAAEYLGVSTRAVERYTAAGKLHCSYLQGKFGKEAFYQPSDLDNFKGELSRNYTAHDKYRHDFTPRQYIPVAGVGGRNF